MLGYMSLPLPFDCLLVVGALPQIMPSRFGLASPTLPLFHTSRLHSAMEPTPAHSPWVSEAKNSDSDSRGNAQRHDKDAAAATGVAETKEADADAGRGEDASNHNSNNNNTATMNTSHLQGIRLFFVSFLNATMLFLVQTEIFIVTTSLVAISEELGDFDAASWILASYFLGYVSMCSVRYCPS